MNTTCNQGWADPAYLPPSSAPARVEWWMFAQDYAQARSPVVWHEKSDFVLNLMSCIHHHGGLTEGQWQAAVRDYRLPAWRAHRRRLLEQAYQQNLKQAVPEQPDPTEFEEDYAGGFW